jgi:DNA-binding MarR family transcriptional regulator
MIDQKNQEELEESIELFFFAYRAFTSRPDRMLEQRGLGRVHHRILHFVGRNPQIAVNALLGILGVSKQALNAPLRQLIEMKLVTVEFAEHDRRVKQLSLTTTGRQLEQQLTGTQMKHLAATFAATGPEAEQAWRAVMRALPAQS